MNKKGLINKIIYFLIAVVTMLIISYGFVPQVLSDKVVDQGDIRGFRGMARETDLWNAEHPDDKTAWTNSMFGGMPTIMITGNHDGDMTVAPFKLLQLGKRPATYFFICMLGSLLLLLAFGISLIPSTIGAIAISFCSYNMQIIQVGHNTKMLAMAFLPWVLAACVFTYKSALIKLREGSAKEKLMQWLPKTFLGAALFAFATSFQIKANHIQISYYLAIILAIYVITLFIWIVAKKENRDKMGRFWIASLLLLVIGSVGIATNANNLIPTYKYSHETMRGGSELASNNAEKGKKGGLDLDYATAWSYGWNELPNLLIPNYNGGSSVGELPMDSETVSLLRQAGQPNISQVAKSLPLYWGPQPFTAGPMYMGAITIFLFLLGLLLYKEKEKWWLLVTTIIAILLGLGSHFMPFTELWFNYAPFYNKFRTVSMAIIILQYTLPILGFLVLDRILKGEYSKKEFTKKSLIALGITAGFCLLVYLIPTFAGTFTNEIDKNYPPQLVQTLQLDRMSLLKSDALTSFIFIILTFAILYWAYTSKDNEKGFANKKSLIACGTIGILILINMGSVGKRYLNDEHFVSAVNFNRELTPTLADKEIFKDKDPDFRVLDLTANMFNESRTSYFHKSIGGYSPVKMQRYQDLIDNNIQSEIGLIIANINKGGIEAVNANGYMTPVLNMLNDKYYIVGENVPPISNSWAFGHCWFVDSVAVAKSPQEEINLLNKVNLRTNAIIGEDFAEFRSKVKAGDNSKDSIYLVSYAPNELKYKYNSTSDRAVVFSEIYYPDGWVAKVDNNEDIPLFRANWTLRGAILPAGNHELTMRFEPASYRVGKNISRASSILLYLIILASFGGIYIESKKEEDL